MRIEILCLLHFCRPGFRTLHIPPWSSKDLQVLRICRSQRLDMGLKRVMWVRRYQGQCRALRPLGHQGYRLRSYNKDQPLCSGYNMFLTWHHTKGRNTTPHQSTTAPRPPTTFRMHTTSQMPSSLSLHHIPTHSCSPGMLPCWSLRYLPQTIHKKKACFWVVLHRHSRQPKGPLQDVSTASVPQANGVGEVSGIRAWTSEPGLPNQNIVQPPQLH